MKFILSLTVLALGYHSLTYGIYLIKTEKKKLPAFGVFLVTIVGTIIAIIDIYSKL